MSAELASSPSLRPSATRSRIAVPPGAAPVLLGLALLVIPTLVSLARLHWSTESGAHGPLILVSGLWLLWRERAAIDWRPGSIRTAWLFLLAPLLLAYVYGRSLALLGTESLALYFVLLLLGFFYWGPATMRRLWFPILYLAFLIKPPFGLVAEATQPLKIAISQLSVSLLHAFGLPIGASGVAIQIAQYELLVRQACSGLGSLLTLLAMGLLFVHLSRPAGRNPALFLLLAIIPIALLANFLRVLGLILLTYYVGDGVAQSFAHDLAGLVSFSLAMLGMFAVDSLLRTGRGGASA
ncbi:exosortase [Sphingomonas ginkgonis]|nr:exosortase [Sphingomonas ginkgonis]